MCLRRLLRCIVFQAPSPPSYDENRLHIDYWAETAHGTRLPVTVWSNPDLLLPRQLRRLVFEADELDAQYPGTTILYSHGNGEDVGQISGMLRAMARVCKANVVAYDYSGYGVAAGKATEEHVYGDAEAAYRVVTEQMGVRPEKVVLYGRSMGSGPTMFLAATRPCKAVVLHSPMLSLVRTHCNCLVCCDRTWDADMFANVDRASRVRVPVYILHGVKDRVVPVWHGRRLHELLDGSENPMWIEDGDHNNMRMSGEAFFNLVKRFLIRVDARKSDADMLERSRGRAAAADKGAAGGDEAAADAVVAAERTAGAEAEAAA